LACLGDIVVITIKTYILKSKIFKRVIRRGILVRCCRIYKRVLVFILIWG